MQIVMGSLVKAVIMSYAVLALAAGEPYWHQILLVLISAVATGIIMFVQSEIQARRLTRVDKNAAERIAAVDQKIEDLKTHHGLNRRHGE